MKREKDESVYFRFGAKPAGHKVGAGAIIVPDYTKGGRKGMTCENCGAKTGLGKLMLANGDELCRKCAEKIPKMWRDYAETNWTLAEYKDFINYKSPDFKETDKIGGLLVDRRGSIKIDGVVIKGEAIEKYEISFNASTYKKGLIADKVTGEGRFTVIIGRPQIKRSISLGILSGAAQKRGDEIKYDMPKELVKLQAIMERITSARSNEESARFNEEENTASSPNIPRRDREYEDALTLFMFNSLDNITPEELKAQRNRLIKTFHTDAGGETEQAERINAAYEILKKHLPKEAS